MTARSSLILAALSLLTVTGEVHAEIGTSTGWVPPAAIHPLNRDDWNIASTIDTFFISSLTPSFVTAAQLWKNGNGLCGSTMCQFVLPGDPVNDVVKNLQSINASELSVEQYNPWVIDNNDFVNFITLPSGAHYSRHVTGQDAGGTNFLLKYTPVITTDPTKINFLQVIHTTYASFELPLSVPSDYTHFDSSDSSPYYNFDSLSGVDNILSPTVPLTIPPSGAFAWMADSPVRCENNYYLGFEPGCGPTTRQNDGIITKVTSIFDTYIVGDVPVGDQVYQVVYGGVEWGYTYRNRDTPPPVPELSTWAMLLVGFTWIGIMMRWRARNAPSPT